MDFMWRNARLLDRRLFGRVFAGEPAEGVVTSLRAYQNDDGGFGHALEPDLRGPASQPIHVDTALRYLHEAKASAPELVARACSYLLAVSDESGGVPAIVESAKDHPRAEHWQPEFWTAEAINPTATIAGLLYALRVGHVWLDRAGPFCWKRLTESPVPDGPSLVAAYTFLDHVADRREAQTVANIVAEQIPNATFFSLQPGATSGYALTPLDLARSPQAIARQFFADELIDAHLEQLEQQQEADGGWSLSWDPPGPGAVNEWRGRVTLDALQLLRAYGRLG